MKGINRIGDATAEGCVGRDTVIRRKTQPPAAATWTIDELSPTTACATDRFPAAVAGG